MNSQDIVIRTERTLIDVVYEIDGKLTRLQQELEAFRQETRSAITELKAEQRVLNGKLEAQQSTLSFILFLLGLMFVGATILFVEQIGHLIDAKLAERR